MKKLGLLTALALAIAAFAATTAKAAPPPLIKPAGASNLSSPLAIAPAGPPPPSVHPTCLAGYSYAGELKGSQGTPFLPSVGSTLSEQTTTPYNPALYNTYSHVAAYVDVDNNQANGTWNWIQAGMEFDGQSSQWTLYTETEVGGSYNLYEWSGVAQGTTHTFALKREGTNTYSAWIDGTKMGSSVTFPSVAPFKSEFMTENYHAVNSLCNEYDATEFNATRNGASAGFPWTETWDFPNHLFRLSASSFRGCYIYNPDGTIC